MAVCEISLFWILNMRRGLRMLAIKHNNDFSKLNELTGIKQNILKLNDVEWVRTELNEYVDNDCHSNGSFLWTFRQAKLIDEMGFHKWVSSTNSAGYKGYISSTFVGKKWERHV